MSDDEPLYSDVRRRRLRRISLILIGALVLMTGGSTVLAIIFG